MSRVNETRFLVQHESCECQCGLNENVCNSKQEWNHDKCLCESKESVEWSLFDKIARGALVLVIVYAIKHAELVSI